MQQRSVCVAHFQRKVLLTVSSEGHEIPVIPEVCGNFPIFREWSLLKYRKLIFVLSFVKTRGFGSVVVCMHVMYGMCITRKNRAVRELDQWQQSRHNVE